jgi:hypothetical protein
MFVPAIVPPQNLCGQCIPGTGFKISFNIPAQQSYRVLSSTDLTVPFTNWVQIASGTAVSNSVIVTDTDGDAARFYRAVSP